MSEILTVGVARPKEEARKEAQAVRNGICPMTSIASMVRLGIYPRVVW